MAATTSGAGVADRAGDGADDGTAGRLAYATLRPLAGTVKPTREDGVARGLAEAIGGPLGEHAATPRPGSRLLSPAAVVILVALAVFGLHWLQKSPCQDGVWENYEQYTKLCYTDVLALYGKERLNEGAVPYFDHPVEYPVLTGYLMGIIGLPVHALGEGYQTFYNLNALVLIAFGVAAVAVTLALRRRRPWDALLFVLAPALVVTATVNWDLLAVGLTAFFFLAWARQRPVVAGIMLGLATAAKFYPMLLLGPLLVLALRTGRFRALLSTALSTAVTWAVVNAPPFLYARESWQEFFRLSTERAVDWGTFWYIGAHWPPLLGEGEIGIRAFVELTRDVDQVNLLSYLLLAVGCFGIFLLGMLAPRRPRLAQLCFLVVALFLLTSKVWSQQFVLWLIPLAVLARPRWGALLVWQAAEFAYFLGFYAHLLNLAGRSPLPEAGYVYISALRWWGLVFFCVMVVWDILAPRRDVVWATYGDDPDGGDFAGAPDAPWTSRIRETVDNALRTTRDRLAGVVDTVRDRVRSPIRG